MEIMVPTSWCFVGIKYFKASKSPIIPSSFPIRGWHTPTHGHCPVFASLQVEETSLPHCQVGLVLANCMWITLKHTISKQKLFKAMHVLASSLLLSPLPWEMHVPESCSFRLGPRMGSTEKRARAIDLQPPSAAHMKREKKLFTVQNHWNLGLVCYCKKVNKLQRQLCF